jgi:hypothetical protein
MNIRAIILALVFSGLAMVAQAHEHHAPHGGCLVEVGEEFAHVELVFEAETATLRAYVLDGEAEGSVRIAQRTLRLRLDDGALLTLSAHADPLTGEGPGDSSEFSLHAAKLLRRKRLMGVVESLSVRGGHFKNLPFSCTLDSYARP